MLINAWIGGRAASPKPQENTVAKHKNLAVTNAAGLAGRALAALEAEGAKIAASMPNGHDRTLQLISTKGAFSALIKHGNKTFQFEGDSFAVTTHD